MVNTRSVPQNRLTNSKIIFSAAKPRSRHRAGIVAGIVLPLWASCHCWAFVPLCGHCRWHRTAIVGLVPLLGLRAVVWPLCLCWDFVPLFGLCAVEWPFLPLMGLRAFVWPSCLCLAFVPLCGVCAFVGPSCLCWAFVPLCGFCAFDEPSCRWLAFVPFLGLRTLLGRCAVVRPLCL